MHFILTIFTFSFWLANRSFNLSFGLNPLDWRAGVAFEGANPEADFPVSRVVLHFPTLALELCWMTEATVTALAEHVNDE